MNREDQYEQLRKQLEDKHKQRLRALELEHKQNLAWLERIFGMLNEDEASLAATHKYKMPVRTLTAAVKDVLSEIPGKFDINTIIGLVEEHHPEIKTPINPTSVSGILRSLFMDDTLDLVEAGAGQKPAIYKVNRLDEDEK